MAPNCGRGTKNLYWSGRLFGNRGNSSSTLASTPPASVAPTLCANAPRRASNESASPAGVGNGQKAEGDPSEGCVDKSAARSVPSPNVAHAHTSAATPHTNRQAIDSGPPQ